MPTVSVIIPSYNHARFLDQRIQSVLGQTYRDFEVLFLDDASTDNTLEVFAKYKNHPNIQALNNESNSGNTFKQWNKGVRAARGAYIWFAESDDVAEPRFLETLVPLLDAHPNVGLAYCASILVDEAGAKVGDMDWWTDPIHPTHWKSDYLSRGAEECLCALVHRNTIPNASAVLLRKATYEQAGYADETMRFCGDWSTWVKLLLVSDVAYAAAPLNHFRVAHPHCVRSRTDSQLAYLEERLRILQMIRARLPLPPTVAEQVFQSCAAEWVGQLHRAAEAARGASNQVLPLAQAIDPALFFTLLTASLTAAVRGGQRIVAVESAVDARLAQLDSAVANLCDSLKQTHMVNSRLQDRVAQLEWQTQTVSSRLQDQVAQLEGQLHQRNGELRGSLAQVEYHLQGMNAQVQGLADSMRFWNRVRRVMMPFGGRIHRLARKVRRMLHRAA
jgi:hypothetical protein